MNKELIKKYKDEFLYWLNEGEVLFYDNKKWKTMDKYTCLWEKAHDRVKFVINDEYVEFRKALAEGKTIQCRVDENRYHWYDMEDKSFLYGKSNYRIKPEEPEFKVGDWVIEHDKYYDANIVQVDETLLESITNEHTYNTFELWQPKENEYCWNKTFGLVKFLCIIDQVSDEGYERYEVYSPFFNEKYNVIILEPHIGKLPTFLTNKERK